MKILVINPGGTSTKIAVFEDDKQLFKANITHTAEDLKPFHRVFDQFGYGVSTANEPLITAVYAAAQQIIRAVEAGGDVYMDGYKVGQRTTASQNRQNRVYGKTLQNV